jgi:hypothetical protein
MRVLGTVCKNREIVLAALAFVFCWPTFASSAPFYIQYQGASWIPGASPMDLAATVNGT